MTLNSSLACPTNNSIFESNDALKRYLADLRQRREQRKFTREERERLQEAITLVTAEWDAAKQDADAEIAQELEAVLQQFAQRLSQLEEAPHTFAIVRDAAVDTVTLPLSESVPAPSPPAASLPTTALPPTVNFRQTLPAQSLETPQLLAAAESLPFVVDSQTVPLLQTSSPAMQELNGEILLPSQDLQQEAGLTAAEYAEVKYADTILVRDRNTAEGMHRESSREPQAKVVITPDPVTIVSSSSVPEVAPLSEEERNARLALLTSELSSIETRWREIDKESLRRPEGGIHRPRCLQTRALACELGGLNARANAQGVGKELRGAIVSVRERMELARAYADDNAPCLPFEPTFWSNVAAQLSADDWAEMAKMYASAADAQSAYDWYMEHKDALENGARWGLLNAIAAVQQRLFCVLEEVGGKDRLQADLYIYLRAAADSEGYLPAMNPNMAWAERQSMAAQLPQLLQNAQRAVAANIERKAKEVRKAAALADVLEWHAQRKTEALSKFTLDKQKAEIARLLDECMEAGIPPTNIQVRSALLEIGPLLLEKQAKYRKFLEAVLTERKRKGLDAPEKDAAEEADVEDDEPADSQMETYRQFVSLYTEGQKLLILGGVPRQRVCEELEKQLACAEVKWPDSKKSDRANKFQGDINRADILIVVKNFASHEMTEKGREWMRAQGKPFILLPSGYGVNQIIHQLYNYATLRENGGDMPALIAAPGSSMFQLT